MGMIAGQACHHACYHVRNQWGDLPGRCRGGEGLCVACAEAVHKPVPESGFVDERDDESCLEHICPPATQRIVRILHQVGATDSDLEGVRDVKRERGSRDLISTCWNVWI